MSTISLRRTMNLPFGRLLEIIILFFTERKKEMIILLGIISLLRDQYLFEWGGTEGNAINQKPFSNCLF